MFFATHYFYLIVFVGMIFGGEGVLIPAVYFALLGKLKFLYLIPIAISAAVISDLAWYTVGKLSPSFSSRHLLFEKRRRVFETVERFFHNHGLKTLFYSKFIYGTRIIAQLMAGRYQTSFIQYFLVNMLGTVTLVFFISGAGALVWTWHKTADVITALNTGVAFIIFATLVGCLHAVAWLLMRMRRNGMKNKNDVIQ